MRFVLCVAALVGVAWPAFAEIVTPNHLDCRFNDETATMTCPEVPSGRSAAAPIEPPAVSSVPTKPGKGSAAWNAACAAKYKSFDPATGNYRSYNGKSRPCL
jgi:hypothetical protein